MFVLTESRIKANEIQSSVAAGCSILACLTVLLLSLWIWTVPSARNCLDRLSFRLLLHALAFEVVYDTAYLVVVVPGINGRQPAGVCAAGVYFMMAGMGVVNYLVSSIAVNLAVTIVLGFNPIRLKLERYYIGFSMFIGFFVPIIPAALGHFGWDPVLDVCWIKADSDRERIRNMVLDLYLWQLLSCLIAIIAVIPTLFALFRQGRATSKAFMSSDSMNLAIVSNSSEGSASGDTPSKQNLVKRIIHRRRQSRENARTFGHLQDRFVKIAIKIAAYPVALVVINGVITIGDLYISSTGGVQSKAEYGLYVVYYFLYGARGCVFVTLCVFVDPCLRNGLKQLWADKFPRKNDSQDLTTTAGNDGLAYTTAIDPNEKDGRLGATQLPAGGDMDFMTALFLDEEPKPGQEPKPSEDGAAEQDESPKVKWRKMFKRRDTDNSPTPSASTKATTKATPQPSGVASPGYSHAFAGVPLSAMPEGLSDGADDVVQREVLAHAKAVADLERALATPPKTPSGGGVGGGGVTGAPGISLMNQLHLVDKLSRRVDRRDRGSTPSSRPASNPPTPAASREGSIVFPDSGRRGSMASGSGSARRPSAGANLLAPRVDSRRPSDFRIRSPRTLEDDRRQRCDRAFDLAERLYEELESQL